MPLRLDIVTIERLICSGEVDMVIAPGIEGELGILPHHAPLLTALKYGEISAVTRTAATFFKCKCL